MSIRGNQKEEFINFALKENFPSLKKPVENFFQSNNNIQAARISIQPFYADKNKYDEMDIGKLSKYFQNFNFFENKFQIKMLNNYKISLRKSRGKKENFEIIQIGSGQTNKSYQKLYFSYIRNKLIISKFEINIHENIKKTLFDINAYTKFFYDSLNNKIFNTMPENNNNVATVEIKKITNDDFNLDNFEEQNNDNHAEEKILLKINYENQDKEYYVPLNSNKIPIETDHFLLELEKAVDFQIDTLFSTDENIDLSEIITNYSPVYFQKKNYKKCLKNTLIITEIKNNDNFSEAKNQILIRLSIIRDIIQFTDPIYCMIILNSSNNIINEKRIEIIKKIEKDFNCKMVLLNIHINFLNFDFIEFKKPRFYCDYNYNKLEKKFDKKLKYLLERFDNLEKIIKDFINKESSSNPVNSKKNQFLGKKHKIQKNEK